MAKKFYVVWKGRNPGIYTEWGGSDGCEAQISGFNNSEYQSFSSQDVAERAFSFASRQAAAQAMKTFSPDNPKSNGEVVSSLPAHFIVCSASFNDKALEYRYMEQNHGQTPMLNSSPAYQGGDLDLGHFFALVDAIVWAGRHHKLSVPIYSDSTTAQEWIRTRKIDNTGLMSPALDELVRTRTQALSSKTFQQFLEQADIRAWDAQAWGISPAHYQQKAASLSNSLSASSARKRSIKGKMK